MLNPVHQVYLQKQTQFAVVAFFIVGLLGLVMRYKLAYELPIVNQKHFQHAHSHFAFAAWVTHGLYILVLRILPNVWHNKHREAVRYFLAINLLSAAGMLVAFSLQGYGLFSIVLSTVSMVNMIVFSIFYIATTKLYSKENAGINYIRFGLILSILSTIGTGLLIYILASKNYNQSLYLGSIYWYLHFQYNGWFFFALAGVIVYWLANLSKPILVPNTVFYCFAIAIIPAYGLSVLWLNLNIWLLIIVAIAAGLQLLGFGIFIKTVGKRKTEFSSILAQKEAVGLLYILVALIVKLLMQLFSVIPSVSDLAFGFRPIVIAYLHLVFLGFTSVGIVTMFSVFKLSAIVKESKVGWYLLLATICINEILLGIQGVLSIKYIVLPYGNEILFFNSVPLVISLALLVNGQMKFKRSEIL